jgi:hypothetical protein
MAISAIAMGRIRPIIASSLFSFHFSVYFQLPKRFALVVLPPL